MSKFTLTKHQHKAIILSKFSNFPDELSKNDELREHKLSGSDCTWKSP